MIIESLNSASWALPAVILLLAGLGHLSFRLWVSRRSSTQSAEATAQPSRFGLWLSRSIESYARPILLLLWTHGLYLAARLALRSSAYGEDPTLTRAIDTAYGVTLTVALFWLFLRVGARVDELLRRLSAHTGSGWDDVMLPVLGRAARRLLPLLALPLGTASLQLPAALTTRIHTITAIGIILLIGWLLAQAVEATASFVLRRHRLDVDDNLQARAIHTQIGFLQKTAHTIIAVLTLGSILMVFQPVRQFGASILASAGIAGIVVGLAAQRSLSTLLAGFQLAMTQPIRVDDVVIVEGEWGRVEEITLTYVVVRIWDDRRLVVPITHFIEKPFQNWTRTGAALTGSVFLYVDYSVPVDALRREAMRITESSRFWDRRVAVLQVTDIKERAVEVRILVSANNAGALFDLRCEVRERMISFMQSHYPAAWPQLRTALFADNRSTEVAGSSALRSPS